MCRNSPKTNCCKRAAGRFKPRRADLFFGVDSKGMNMDIGVLALQGDFAKHIAMLERIGARAREVRTASDLKFIQGLIIPGGERTTMLKLMRDEGLFEPLRDFARTHPTFGTCAGVILMAGEVRSPAQPSLQLMDITVERNGYGRQIDSFTTF